MKRGKQSTREEVARLARVDPSTVSRALSHHPAISEETRRRVEEIAYRLNYHPNPVASILAKYRGRRNWNRRGMTIGYLMDTPVEQGWPHPLLERIHSGAVARANQLGCVVERIWMREPGMDPGKLSEHLLHKGIRGFVLSPLVLENFSFELDWKEFAAVGIGHRLQSPKLHTAGFDHFHSMKVMLEKIRRRGYKNPALVIGHHEVSRNQWVSAFLSGRMDEVNSPYESLLLATTSESEYPIAFERWWSSRGRRKPDVLIFTIEPQSRIFLNRLSNKAREEIDTALLAKADENPDHDGIKLNFEELGAQAVSLLRDMLQRGAFGVPDPAHSILVPGKWSDGKSLRR